MYCQILQTTIKGGKYPMFPKIKICFGLFLLAICYKSNTAQVFSNYSQLNYTLISLLDNKYIHKQSLL